MTTISAKFDQIRAGVVQTGAAFVQGAKNAGQAVANAGKAAGNFLVNPQAQKNAEAAFRAGVNTAYSAINGGIKAAVTVMERETSTPGQVKGGIEALRAPIAAMRNFTIPRFDIDEALEGNGKTLKKAANAMAAFHQAVVRGGELASREAGDKTHALLRAALTPIRFLFKLVNLESVGALIQNSISLAAAFAVRGLVLGLSQLGHLVPYVVAAALIGGTVLGVAALAIKVSPLVAAIVVIGLIFAAQQAQILSLGRKVDNLTNTLTTERRQAAQNTAGAKTRRTLGKVASAATSGVKAVGRGLVAVVNAGKANKGKVAATVVTSAAMTAAYLYAPQIAGVAAPFAKSAVDAVSPYLASSGTRIANFANSAAGIGSSLVQSGRGLAQSIGLVSVSA